MGDDADDEKDGAGEVVEAEDVTADGEKEGGSDGDGDGEGDRD